MQITPQERRGANDPFNDCFPVYPLMSQSLGVCRLKTGVTCKSFSQCDNSVSLCHGLNQQMANTPQSFKYYC